MTKLSPQAERVLKERYYMPGEDFPKLVRRVATAVAQAEREELREFYTDTFEGAMLELKFLPNSPTLMNAGKGNGLQLSACYVLPVEDDLGEIFETVKNAALVHKSGGGTGFSFSSLRANGQAVGSTGGIASGPVSFLTVFDAATQAVKQGGTRRGANMGILRVDHPDIEEFIDCKRAGGILNFNISVAVTDAFMEAVQKNILYPLVDHEGKVVRWAKARDVMDKIVEAAWATGDPGLIFIDTVNSGPANPDRDREVEATNPCGEVPLYPYEACNLGSINLAKFWRDGVFNYEELERIARVATHFLDDVIEINPYPLPEIREAVLDYRRIGLGVMGWADLLSMMEIPYGSPESLALADRIMSTIRRAAVHTSQALARIRGPFRKFDTSIYSEDTPIRNATLTTIAPTGTISIIAGCSSGIEPHFALAYSHEAPGSGRKLDFFNPVLDELTLPPSTREYVETHGTLPEESNRHPFFLTAHEIDPSKHIAMQVAFQEHTDNAVSKTINMPNSATLYDIRQAYFTAHESGCLGITVYRDGCKGYAGQVLHAGKEETVDRSSLRERGVIVAGYTQRIVAPEGKVNVTLNSDEDGPLEVFVNVGKAGSDVSAVAEAIGRLCSLVLRVPSAVSVADRLDLIADQLENIGGSRSVGLGPNQVRSLPDAIARVLRDFSLGSTQAYGIPLFDEGTGGIYKPDDPRIVADLCPECGGFSLVRSEGCKKCEACGYSEC